MRKINIGNTVRVRSTEATEKLKIAGLTGGVFDDANLPDDEISSVIGEPTNALVYRILFEDVEGTFWLSEDLLEWISDELLVFTGLDSDQEDGWIPSGINPHDHIKTRADFIEFVNSFSEEVKQDIDNPDCNTNLVSFLRALAHYASDVPGYYKNQGLDVNCEEAAWHVFATLLAGAFVYE